MSRARSVWGATVVLGAMALLACSSAESATKHDDAGVDAGTAFDATVDVAGDGANDSQALLPDGSLTDAPPSFEGGGEPDDASGDAAETGTPLGSDCPTSLPAAGLSCPASGVWCEYGGGLHERCSTSAYCDIAQWSDDPPDPSCTLANVAACPSFYGESPDASCPLDDGSCDYDAGRCACVECAVDGGPDGFQWFCRAWNAVNAYADDGGAALDLPGACPANRAPLGTPCDAGFECGYDACYGVSLGPYEWCRDGTWGVGPQTDLCDPPMCR